MAETLAKVWFKYDKNIIELTANTDSVTCDVYSSKWKLIRKHIDILFFLIFKKMVRVKDKEEVVAGANIFIDNYYADEILNTMMKEQLRKDIIPETNSIKEYTPDYFG